MWRYGSDGPTLKVRMGAIILLCAQVLSLLALSSSVHGLAVDPLVDRAISVTKLNMSENSFPDYDQRGPDKPERNPALGGSNPFMDRPVAVASSSPEPASPVLAVPMAALPPIDAFDANFGLARTAKPTSPIAVSSVMAVVDVDHSSLLRTSNHGWKIFEIAWYWWAVAIGLGYFIILQLVRLKCRQNRNDTIIS